MIRQAAADDASAVRHIVDSAYRHYIARIGKPPGPMLDDYAALIALGQVWVLEEGQAPAGILVLKEADGDALLLDNVAIAPHAQGRGHGRTLMDFAAAEARRRGRREMRLYTHVLMIENVALYERLGYRETGRITEHGYQRIYMAKLLG